MGDDGDLLTIRGNEQLKRFCIDELGVPVSDWTIKMALRNGELRADTRMGLNRFSPNAIRAWLKYQPAES